MTYTRKELNAINSILTSLGQAPVTAIDSDGSPSYPTNPDVAMAYNTLMEVSEEVQSEGWTYNRELHYPIDVDQNNEIPVPANVLQIDLCEDFIVFSNAVVSTGEPPKPYYPEIVQREGKLYDKANHTYKFNKNPTYFDVLWLYPFDDIPTVIRDYIVARAAVIASMRVLGDTNQYQLLQQRELYCRAVAIEYETNQGDYSYFGRPESGSRYNSYQPYKSLMR